MSLPGLPPTGYSAVSVTFESRKLAQPPGTTLHEDRFCSVELGIVFRQVTCYRCNFSDIYRYAIKELRRKSRREVEKGGKLNPDQHDAWQSIPRYAEIPETLRCKKCGEILGLYTECIF